MIDIDHYTYRVTWSAEDDEFVGLVAELPSLSWLAPTQVQALDGIRGVVCDVVADLGGQAPRPFAERTYSGAFKVRVPPQLHRSLVIEAAEQGVSLNRLVSSRLSS
ncbi:MAG: type II toxin-antitoxin system HicB family antitoxin [Rhodoglobus sp.]